MGSRPDEISLLEIIRDMEELLFISKFLQNKKELKEERKILKKMVDDFKKDKYEKYISCEDIDYE